MTISLRYLANVSSLKLDAEKCSGCGLCLAVCPREVFVFKEGKAADNDPDACMECGACSRNCPTGAVTVTPGTGCAAALINSALGRRGKACCCSLERNRQTDSENCC